MLKDAQPQGERLNQNDTKAAALGALDILAQLGRHSTSRSFKPLWKVAPGYSLATLEYSEELRGKMLDATGHSVHKYGR